MVGVWLFALRLASSEPPKPAGYELEWDAPADCSDVATVEARVAEVAPAPEGGAGLVSLCGEVHRTAAGYALRLRTEFLGGVDEPVVESDSCADLGETTALFVAVALDPMLGDGRDADPMPGQPPVQVLHPPSGSPPEALGAPDSGETRLDELVPSPPDSALPPPRRDRRTATDRRPATRASTHSWAVLVPALGSATILPAAGWAAVLGSSWFGVAMGAAAPSVRGVGAVA